MTIFETFFTDPYTFQMVFSVAFPLYIFGEYPLAWLWVLLSLLNGLSGYQVSVSQLGILIIVVWMFREFTALATWTTKSPFKDA